MNKTKKNIVDSVVIKQKEREQLLHKTIENNYNKNIQTLLLGGERTDFFVTEDSRKYISQIQQYKKDYKYNYIDSRGYFDSVHIRYVRTYSASELQQKQIIAEFRTASDIAKSFKEALKLDISPIRMWQVSLAGAVLFGMISMSMIYKNLGQSVAAKGNDVIISENDKKVELVVNRELKTKISKDEIQEEKQIKEQADKKEKNKQKLDEKNEKLEVDLAQKNTPIKENEFNKKSEKKVTKEKNEDKKNKQLVDSVQKKQIKKEKNKVIKEYSLKREAKQMVEGYPIEKMLPYILEQDPEVAKYLIAIAKQESQWGKRVPVLNGQDCYNYWGYRGKRKLMGSGGHTCFNSRKDAVETVGKRIHELIYKYDRKSAKRLIVWKCGSTCEGHSQAGVDRWIGTVDTYYKKLSE